MNEAFAYGLTLLEMLGDSNHTTGLVRVSTLEEDRSQLNPEEIIALESAANYDVDYVYFRRFNNRPSISQVYIYDYTEQKPFIEDELVQLHKQLYSSGLTPMFFVFTKNQVIIFNCLEKPAEGDKFKYKPLTTIQLASEAENYISEVNIKKLQSFSGRSFDNGTFWEDSYYSKFFKAKNGAYEQLLSELKQALKDIVSKKILPAAIARKFMVIAILIKYLEDRVDAKGNSVFPKQFFGNFFAGAQTFTDVLQDSEATASLLKDLASHFGGEVFRIDDDEQQAILSTDLRRFAQFLQGDLKGIQFVFWKLYSFNDLPIELISNIYEEFLGKKPGVVYTPPYLVNFILDEVLPLSEENTKLKILDPACGSGVFLVGAYRRLIQRWRKSNNWQTPNLATLKELLVNSIYGVDKDADATNLTIFSLSLALCDELTPKQIWEELRFDNLRERNIYNDDFFNILLTDDKFTNIGFDLIIGNPPFESKLTLAGRAIEKLELSRNRIPVIIGEHPIIVRGGLPDNQIALLFLEQSINISKKGGLVCLIQPSGPLLYNKSSLDFRRNMLRRHHIPQIIDFTHISRTLFGARGDVATAAIFAKNEPAQDKGLLHITVRRTKVNKEKLYFELDSYDFHYVPREKALNDVYIWKANLLGGHRYHQFISRLSELRTLGQYLQQQKESRKWVISEGFTLATRGDIQELNTAITDKNLSKWDKLERKLTANFLTGKRYLPTDAFTEDGIDYHQIRKLEDKYFHSKGDELAYHPPHILIKEVVSGSEIPSLLSNEYLIFNNSVIGIHAPKEDYTLLEELFQKLSKSTLYSFYLAGTSGRYMVNKSSSVLKNDIENLPFPEDSTELNISHFEQILIDDFNQYLLDFRRKGENSAGTLEDASRQSLIEFGQVYCEVLNSVYKSVQPYQYFETDSFICYPFFFGNKPDIEFNNSAQLEKHISNLATKVYGLNTRITRLLRMYEHNIIYLIKPKKVRYWLKSIALRDADETFSDLRKQGY